MSLHTAQMNPKTFKRLSNAKMRDEMKKIGLDETGRKVTLVERYEAWWIATSEGQESELAQEPRTAGSSKKSDDSVGGRAGILSVLLFPHATKISAATASCLTLLEYGKKGEFKLKDTTEDLSSFLIDVKIFVENWVGAQREVTPATSSNIARNIYELEAQLSKRLSLSPVDPDIVGLLTRWGLRDVEPAISPPNYDEVSTTQKPREQLTALRKELHIVENAMRFRLSRWLTSFPGESVDQVSWPTSFSIEEKNAMREFIRRQMSVEMWIEERSNEDIAIDVTEIRNSEEFEKFPVVKGKAASIVTQILKELRNTKTRSESRSENRRARKSDSSITSSTNSTVSTNPSSTISSGASDSTKRARDEDDDALGEAADSRALHAHSRKRAQN
ncbi:uncharacterized protein CC84DRAFT_827420 [Paraphaeosphaeria sporulosa]|uniref:SAP domain-containing protein n=1 Tax=Paraphaeosphaeria sporulosa TaxID=1460663 RepID=A0A177CE65_9PLEO|nr:uncharacterized protein CC84DRAFT_827420 [Paraphaeosphaeria sporulosa]OAG05099.1 hypothetical protein CC84DRAFT_827420 [Paraphaeosphaeria sporulosa]